MLKLSILLLIFTLPWQLFASGLFGSDDFLSVRFHTVFPVENESHGFIELKDLNQKLPAKFLPRGNLRKNICFELPPFKIVFDEQQKKGTAFDGVHPQIKVVTSCLQENALYHERVRIEFVLYQLLLASGLPSFQVRGFFAEYISPKGEGHGQGPGFFLEPFKDLKKRLNPQIDPVSNLERATLRLNLSHWLVQNVDYHISNLHNVEVIKNKSGEVLEYVAYDFDMSYLIVGEEFFKNIGVDWDDSAQFSYLAINYGESALRQELKSIYSRKSRMEQVIQQAALNAENKGKLRLRLNQFFSAIEKFLNKP